MDYIFDEKQPRFGAVGWKGAEMGPSTSSRPYLKRAFGYVDILKPETEDRVFLRNFTATSNPSQCAHCLRWRNRNTEYGCDIFACPNRSCILDPKAKLKVYAPFPQPMMDYETAQIIKPPQEGWKELATPYTEGKIALCKFCAAQDPFQGRGEEKERVVLVRCSEHQDLQAWPRGDITNVVEGTIEEPLPHWANIKAEKQNIPGGVAYMKLTRANLQGWMPQPRPMVGHDEDPPHPLRLEFEREHPPPNTEYPNPPKLQRVEGGGLYDDLIDRKVIPPYGYSGTSGVFGQDAGTQTKNWVKGLEAFTTQMPIHDAIEVEMGAKQAHEMKDELELIPGRGDIVVPLRLLSTAPDQPGSHAAISWRRNGKWQYWEPHGTPLQGIEETEKYLYPSQVDEGFRLQGEMNSCGTWATYGLQRHVLGTLPAHVDQAIKPINMIDIKSLLKYQIGQPLQLKMRPLSDLTRAEKRILDLNERVLHQHIIKEWQDKNLLAKITPLPPSPEPPRKHIIKEPPSPPPRKKPHIGSGLLDEMIENNQYPAMGAYVDNGNKLSNWEKTLAAFTSPQMPIHQGGVDVRPGYVLDLKDELDAIPLGRGDIAVPVKLSGPTDGHSVLAWRKGNKWAYWDPHGTPLDYSQVDPAYVASNDFPIQFDTGAMHQGDMGTCSMWTCYALQKYAAQNLPQNIRPIAPVSTHLAPQQLPAAQQRQLWDNEAALHDYIVNEWKAKNH